MRETSAVPSKSSTSEPRARLIELMQRLNFGRIESLVIEEGEPVFEPRPRVIRELKFCGENQLNKELFGPQGGASTYVGHYPVRLGEIALTAWCAHSSENS